eukprot:1954794-Pleurochrysis_carterae.AAC.1
MRKLSNAQPRLARPTPSRRNALKYIPSRSPLHSRKRWTAACTELRHSHRRIRVVWTNSEAGEDTRSAFRCQGADLKLEVSTEIAPRSMVSDERARARELGRPMRTEPPIQGSESDGHGRSSAAHSDGGECSEV